MARQPSGEAQDVAINLDRGSLLRGGREIRLRAKTFQVLVRLHEHHGRLVTKEDLFRTVWPDTFVSDDSLTKCIREIRRALGDGGHQLLKTVARRGFILDAPLATVRIADAEAPTATLRESSERRTHNLPAQLTSFIGREREMAELERLLASTRLLTLTGAGGCGKTRLALEVARQMLDEFPDGVWLVDLTPLGDPSLVAQSVAAVLDVHQLPDRSLVDSLADQLRHRRALPAARQLRTRDRQRRRARRNAAQRRARADASRHEPRSARRRRREVVASRLSDCARTAHPSIRGSPRVRGCSIAGRSSDGRWLHVRGHE